MMPGSLEDTLVQACQPSANCRALMALEQRHGPAWPWRPAGLLNPHFPASLVQASGGQLLLEAVEGFSGQAGAGWIVSQPRGSCSLEEIVSRRGDPRLALNQLQEVEQMGLDVAQPGFSIGVLLNLEERLLNARDPFLQHVGEYGMHGTHSLLAEACDGALPNP